MVTKFCISAVFAWQYKTIQALLGSTGPFRLYLAVQYHSGFTWQYNTIQALLKPLQFTVVWQTHPASR